MHGGSSVSGERSGTFKHGLYSKSMPSRLAARYDEALADPDLISLRREAAIVTAQIEEALARLDTGEAGALWLRLRDLWLDMRATADNARQASLLNEIGRTIERGASDASAAREVREVIASKVRVAESERKRLVEAHQMITTERFMVFIGALSRAIGEEVADREHRARILDRIDRLLTAGGGGTAADAAG